MTTRSSMSIDFRAPWSWWLTIPTALVTVLLLGLASGVLEPDDDRYVTGIVPLAALAFGSLFVIRGYTVTADSILVRRLLWSTVLPLTGLRSARVEPDAMRRSLRTFGNGGFFAFSGFFYNKTLGSYRAFVTDPKRTVVLEFEKRKVVLSPDDPQRFVESVVPG